jgi:hypothetical protein
LFGLLFDSEDEGDIFLRNGLFWKTEIFIITAVRTSNPKHIVTDLMEALLDNSSVNPEAISQ